MMILLHSESKKSLPLTENVTFILGRETLHKVFGVIDPCVSRRHVEIVALSSTKWRVTCRSSSNPLRVFTKVGKEERFVKKNDSVVLDSRTGYFYLYGSKHQFSLRSENENEAKKNIVTKTTTTTKKIRIVLRKDDTKQDLTVSIDNSTQSLLSIIARKFGIEDASQIRGLVCRGKNISIDDNSIADSELNSGDILDIVVSNNNDKCAVCLSDITMSEKRGALPCCDHIFHFSCIMTWSKIDNSCPLCKKPFGHIESFTPGDDDHETIEIIIKKSSDDEEQQTTSRTLEQNDTYGGCKRCRSSAREDVLLICDLCEDTWHTYCLPTPLDSVPEGDWYCPQCEEMPDPINTQDSDDEYRPSQPSKIDEEEDEEEAHQLLRSNGGQRGKIRRIVDSEDSEDDYSIDDDDEIIDIVSPPRKRKRLKKKKNKQLPISSWITKRK